MRFSIALLAVLAAVVAIGVGSAQASPKTSVVVTCSLSGQTTVTWKGGNPSDVQVNWYDANANALTSWVDFGNPPGSQTSESTTTYSGAYQATALVTFGANTYQYFSPVCS